MSDQENMRVLADQLFLYMEKKIKGLFPNNVSYFRAQVVSNPGGNRLEVKRPLESTTMVLPCSGGIANALEGSQVTVLVLGGMSNAIVVSDGMLSTL
jgi:hypothetical protein